MLLLPGQSPPPHPSPQAGTFCGISAHESPATGPSRLPQAIRTVPRPLAPSPLPIHRRVAPRRPQTRFPETCPKSFPLAPSESLHQRVPCAQRRTTPRICRAEGSERTLARPGFPINIEPWRRAKKRGGIIPPSCPRFQCVEINDCPDRITRLCRAAHAQSRADRTDAGPPFFRRDPQR